MCILLELYVFCCTSCCNSSHFFLTLNYLKLFLLGISMTKKTFSSLMDLNFLEEFFSGYGKWKISFQQLRHSTFNEFTFCEDEGFLEESEFIITGSYRFGSLKPTGNNYWSPYHGERNFHTFILRQKGKLKILKAAQGDVDTKLHLNLIKSFSIWEKQVWWIIWRTFKWKLQSVRRPVVFKTFEGYKIFKGVLSWLHLLKKV